MKNRKYLARGLALVLFTIFCHCARAQNPTDSLPGDPGFSLTVTKVQDLSFGAFSLSGSDGTVTVSNTGSRTASGSITLLNLSTPFYQAIFDVQAPEGYLLTITNGPDVSLTGSRGGSALLHLGDCYPTLPTMTTAAQPTLSINIGGTLTVSGSSPPGTYTGTFAVTFNYE